jgi:thermitase
MNDRNWIVVGGVVLLLLLWFMMDPQLLLRPPPAPVTEPKRLSGQPANPEASKESQSKGSLGQSPTSSVDRDIETGSGKEVPNEKIVRFANREGLRRFLAMAPPGSVLGQLGALNAARVKSGSWLGAAVQENGGTVSGNFYIRVPEVPLEVRERGDTMYQAVGKKALDLIGAEGVTGAWGSGVTVALMDTPLEGMETSSGETAGHGTAMRSLIAGDAGAARGAAPGVKILGFPVLDAEGKGNSFALAEAIVRAVDQGAKVVNMSLGSDGDSPLVRDAVQYALARNVALVAAAGNDAVNRVSYPAAYDGVVAVASVDAGGNHLYFSNRGKALDLAAPGYAVVAAWPGGKNVEVSGTSASTALVTGAVAALLSQEPGLTGKQAAELLVKYAKDSGLLGSKEEIGSGTVDLARTMERNQRGIVDLAVGGVTLKEEGSVGRISAGVQNRGTETVNSPSLEITAGGERRKFYFGSLAPGQTASESMTFDLLRARQEGGLGAGAAVEVRGDQRNDNDLWSGYFRISKDK